MRLGDQDEGQWLHGCIFVLVVTDTIDGESFPDVMRRQPEHACVNIAEEPMATCSTQPGTAVKSRYLF